MIFILIALVVAVAGAVAAMYLKQRRAIDSRSDSVLASPVRRGLFDHPANGIDKTEAEAANETSQERAALIERAAGGDVEALSDANELADAVLYREVLGALAERAATRQETLRALVSRIATSNNLRASIRVAEIVIATWKANPTRQTTAEALHIAALSDDAKTYQGAVETAIEYSRTGRLPQLSAEDLIALIESQYWVLSSEARSSGAGFALKQKLAGVRRELTTAPTTR